MTMETDLHAALEALCAQVHPGTAPTDTPMPYITWQHIGGSSWRFTENTAPGQRHSLVQVNVWAATLIAALALVRQVEDALCASTAFVARPEGEPIGQDEPDFRRYGLIQDFSIVAAR